MRRILPFVIIALVVSSCGENKPSQQIPDIDSIGESGNIGKCSVSIENVYCWRDWQPVVEKPGKDAGSPLYIKTNINVDNSTGSAAKLSWEAYVFEMATRKFHPVGLIDKNGTPKWHGGIGDSEVKRAELMTHDGPYLDVGSQVILVFCLKDQGGQVVWVKSKKSQIERTD